VAKPQHGSRPEGTAYSCGPAGEVIFGGAALSPHSRLVHDSIRLAFGEAFRLFRNAHRDRGVLPIKHRGAHRGGHAWRVHAGWPCASLWWEVFGFLIRDSTSPPPEKCFPDPPTSVRTCNTTRTWTDFTFSQMTPVPPPRRRACKSQRAAALLRKVQSCTRSSWLSPARLRPPSSC